MRKTDKYWYYGPLNKNENKMRRWQVHDERQWKSTTISLEFIPSGTNKQKNSSDALNSANFLGIYMVSVAFPCKIMREKIRRDMTIIRSFHLKSFSKHLKPMHLQGMVLTCAQKFVHTIAWYAVEVTCEQYTNISFEVFRFIMGGHSDYPSGT